MTLRTMDFSVGDPLLPFTRIAQHAFKNAAKDLNKYTMPANVSLDSDIGRLLHDMSNYFTKRGFRCPGWTGLGSDGMIVTNGGTTEAYEMVIRALAQDVKEHERLTKRTIKPVIVMPVPTYGFFFDNPRNWGIEAVTLPRNMDEGGTLEPRALYDLFQKLDADGKRVVAYYDCNPHNPLGLVRGRTETEMLAKIISWQSNQYEKRDNGWANSQTPPRKKKAASDDIFDLMDDYAGCHLHRGVSSRIKIIDDMAYDGLQYEGVDAPFAFGQLRDGEFRALFRDTFTLFSASKAGLVNLRAGLLIGHPDWLRDIKKMSMSTGYCASKVSYHALHAYFSEQPKFRAWKDTHLKTLNALHQRNGLLMKALINGIDNMEELKPKQRDELITLYATTARTTKIAASKRLQQSIKGLKITTTPQSGFFHLLDFSALKGRQYGNDLVHYKRYEGMTDFEDGYAIEHLSAGVRIKFAYAAWAGLDDSLQTRVSFAKPVEDIIEFANRMEKLVGKTTPRVRVRGHKPSITPLCGGV